VYACMCVYMFGFIFDRKLNTKEVLQNAR